MTTVFSVLTAARNRIGFFLENTFWRKRVHTHLIFFNRYSCVLYFYEQIVSLMDVPNFSFETSSIIFCKSLASIHKSKLIKRIAIGFSCSEMGKERMLTSDQWLEIFLKKQVESAEIIFLGNTNDYNTANHIISKLNRFLPRLSIKNMCGSISLIDAVSYIQSSDEFWGIDSALLHYATLLQKKTVSFWGPTDPVTRLRSVHDDTSEIYYNKVFCSPCLHVAENPPCNGDNICIKAIFRNHMISIKEQNLNIFRFI